MNALKHFKSHNWLNKTNKWHFKICLEYKKYKLSEGKIKNKETQNLDANHKLQVCSQGFTNSTTNTCQDENV